MSQILKILKLKKQKTQFQKLPFERIIRAAVSLF